MRKLLLATVAVLGGSMGISAVAEAQVPTPAPGTVTVRLNGLVRFYAAYIKDGDANRTAGTALGGVAGNGTEKLANYTFATYARLYPGFDGVAANGLKYGASIEIRSDGSSGAGGGTFGSVTGSNRARGELYIRRAFGYLGTDKLGTLRLGGTDGPSSLYITGNFENFDGGGLNGDLPGFLAGNTNITWPFGDVGNMYTTNKAVYLSPQFYGFDFGLAYEPNTGSPTGNSGNNCGTGGFVGTNFVNAAGAFTAATGANGQGVAGPGCDRLSATGSGDYTRRRNTLDAMLRYRGTFGPVGVAVTAGYIVSGKVEDNQTPSRRTTITVANPAGVGGAVTQEYEGFSVGDFGAAVTFGGLSFGGKYQYGDYNGQWGLHTRGTTQGEAWLVGASYTFGPAVVGAHYLDYKSAGDTYNALLGRQRREQGVAAGATYTLAPGLSLFASYLWIQRKQNGFNFVTGETNGVPNSVNANKLTAQAFALGTSFRW